MVCDDADGYCLLLWPSGPPVERAFFEIFMGIVFVGKLTPTPVTTSHSEGKEATSNYRYCVQLAEPVTMMITVASVVAS